MRIGFRVLTLPVACFVFALGFAGCGSDSCGPETCRCGLELGTMWPNDDGRGWEYKYTWRTWSDTCAGYGDVDDVPPAPSLDYVEGLLGKHAVGRDVSSRVGWYKMRFGGDSTTMSGVTAQALRDTAYLPGIAAGLPAVPNPAWALLESGLPPRAGGPGAGSTGPSTEALGEVLTPRPVLIHGGVWEKTEDYIGTYGDIDTLLAWKFLEADLCAGSEFSFDIGGAVGGGLKAWCRVLGNTSVETEMGVFGNGLDCLYVVDLGVMVGTDGHGRSVYRRYITYGNVVYVPDVGPVYSYERFYVCVGDTLSLGAGDMELSLISTGKQ